MNALFDETVVRRLDDTSPVVVEDEKSEGAFVLTREMA